MLWRATAALVAAAVVAAGCGDGSDDSDGTPAEAPAATAAPDTASAAPTDAEAGDTDADGAETAPDDSAAPHPSDAYFALDRVLDISIEIDRDDWDTLRHQTRTLEDVFAEIEEYGLSRPFSDIYTWFAATVTVDGETHADVGVRKKGFVGSQSDTKPSLKLRFDKYTDGQSLGGVMERMTLNNSVQDPSMVNTCLSYRVFAAAGSPAPRCNFATVSVNGKDLGLYVHVEEIKAPFLARHFDSAEGNLYEGTVSDFTPAYRGTIEKKNHEDADDWSDIDAVTAALQDPSDAGLEALGEIVDLDRFLSFWATEVLIGHWDGYAGNRNNYWFYREPAGVFVFIPWGVDGTFHLQDDPNFFDNISDPPPSVLALTAIPNRLYSHPDWQGRLRRAAQGDPRRGLGRPRSCWPRWTRWPPSCSSTRCRRPPRPLPKTPSGSASSSSSAEARSWPTSLPSRPSGPSPTSTPRRPSSREPWRSPSKRLGAATRATTL